MHLTSTMVFLGPPTLFRLSAIAISKHLWRNSSLNDHLKSCIEDRIKEIRETEPLRSAAEIIINNFCVPSPAKEELKFVIGSMGCDMLFWFDKENSIRYRLFSPKGNVCAGDVRTCADNFHWTVFGSVDDSKTMRSLYYARMFTDSTFTWKELALYCLEDCLNDLRPKVLNIDELTNQFPMYHFGARYAAHSILIAYWMARAGNDMESVMIDAFHRLPHNFYDATYSIEGHMFMVMMVASRYEGVEFFWGLMNENEKMRALVKGCEQIIATPKYGWYPRQEVVVFILRKLAHYGLGDMMIRIMGSDSLVPLSQLTWSYDQFFIQAIVELLKHNHIMNYQWIMGYLLQKICYCNANQLFDHDVKYHEFFYTIWKMNLGNFKRCIKDAYLEMLWWAKEVKLLNHILRDPELKDRRKGFLEKLAEALKGKVVDRLFLKKFIAKVLHPEEEWFAKSFPCIQDIEKNVDISE